MALPIELANTIYYSRGVVRDGLAQAADLAAWLRQVQPRLATAVSAADLAAIDEPDLARARTLRDAIRAVAEATASGHPPRPADIETINAQVRAAPSWRELRGRRRLRADTESQGPAIIKALAEIAQAAVDLFATAEVRACQAPHCVLFFVKDNSRREWCSDNCGNRARAARHYARTRARRRTAPDS
jgi:predicted RNA-binding Zn ribbon-like protein